MLLSKKGEGYSINILLRLHYANSQNPDLGHITLKLSSYNGCIWGKCNRITLGERNYSISSWEISNHNDSLTNNDSTWSFQTFSALSQVMVSTGKVKQIIEIDKLSPSVLKDSMFVFDSENDLLLAFWDFKQIPDIFIQTKL